MRWSCHYFPETSVEATSITSFFYGCWYTDKYQLSGRMKANAINEVVARHLEHNFLGMIWNIQSPEPRLAH